MKKLLAIVMMVLGLVGINSLQAVRLVNNNTGTALNFTLTKRSTGAVFSIQINNNAGMSEDSTHNLMNQSIEKSDKISITGVNVPFYDREFTYDRTTRMSNEVVRISLWTTPDYSSTKFVLE